LRSEEDAISSIQYFDKKKVLGGSCRARHSSRRKHPDPSTNNIGIVTGSNFGSLDDAAEVKEIFGRFDRSKWETPGSISLALKFQKLPQKALVGKKGI
jgi:hypothetical protein